MRQPPSGYRWVSIGEILEPTAKVFTENDELYPTDCVGESCYLEEVYVVPLRPRELREQTS